MLNIPNALTTNTTYEVGVSPGSRPSSSVSSSDMVTLTINFDKNAQNSSVAVEENFGNRFESNSSVNSISRSYPRGTTVTITNMNNKGIPRTIFIRDSNGNNMLKQPNDLTTNTTYNVTF